MTDKESVVADRSWRDAFDTSFLFFALAAMIFGAICAVLLGWEAVIASLHEDAGLIGYMLPKLGAAVLIAGFIQALLPPDFFGRYMGGESGMKGIVIASAAGAATPGGPVTSFPMVTLLRDTGAGLGAMVAYITSWTTMGLQRVLMWEVPLMGVEFAIVRFVASIPLPIVAGFLARLFPPEPVAQKPGPD
jgi:uncharacterized membrane protein YraQ (UPF0718 family)